MSSVLYNTSLRMRLSFWSISQGNIYTNNALRSRNTNPIYSFAPSVLLRLCILGRCFWCEVVLQKQKLPVNSKLSTVNFRLKNSALTINFALLLHYARIVTTMKLDTTVIGITRARHKQNHNMSTKVGLHCHYLTVQLEYPSDHITSNTRFNWLTSSQRTPFISMIIV